MPTCRLVGFAGIGPLFENMSIAAIEQAELAKGQLTLADFDERFQRTITIMRQGGYDGTD